MRSHVRPRACASLQIILDKFFVCTIINTKVDSRSLIGNAAHHYLTHRCRFSHINASALLIECFATLYATLESRRINLKNFLESGSTDDVTLIVI